MESEAEVVRDLLGRLALDAPPEALPGADLVELQARGLPLPPPGRLVRAADGFFHPGPPTAWADFSAMARSLGVAEFAGDLPDVRALTIDQLDREAAAWMLPATAVRPGPAAPAPIAAVPTSASASVAGAYVAVLGTAWAAPLVGRLLVLLGVDVVRIDDPRRVDPFPLAEMLAAGAARVTPDLTTSAGRAELADLLATVDLLVDGYTPRVLANAGFDDDVLDREFPHVARLRIAAFADSDRPGYGLAAECRGGWAARTEPPRLGRSSVADPVAGAMGALHAVALLQAGGGSARVSLEGAVGHLLARERVA